MVLVKGFCLCFLKFLSEYNMHNRKVQIVNEWLAEFSHIELAGVTLYSCEALMLLLGGTPGSLAAGSSPTSKFKEGPPVSPEGAGEGHACSQRGDGKGSFPAQPWRETSSRPWAFFLLSVVSSQSQVSSLLGWPPLLSRPAGDRAGGGCLRRV